MLDSRALLIVLISYGLGCFTTGYYLVRYRLGQDIRDFGSGNIGARNVGRVLGTAGFGITLLGDALKGAIGVGLALAFKLAALGTLLALLAVVAGHMWPVQLGFRGGKGIATTLGAMLVFDLRLTLLLIGLFGLIWLPVRRLTLSGLIVIAAAPALAYGLGRPWLTIGGLVVLDGLILIAHRKNIVAIVQRWMGSEAGRGG